MSLKAWYPFINNINNQGLGDLNLTTTNTPAYASDGKIGPTCLNTGGFKWTASQTESVFNNNELTIAFWIKVTGTASGILFGNDGMGASNNRKFSIFQYPDANSLHCSWMNDAASTVFIGFVINNVFPTNVWTHCCITYKNPTCKVYINGVLRDTYTGTSTSTSFAYETQVLHSNSNRSIQDFRIYDNALSAREVKEISKGLRLHYQMKSARITNHAAGYPFTIYNNFSVGASLTQLNETFMGYPVYRLTMTPTSANVDSFKTELWSHGVYHGEFTFSASTKYCYWLYYRPVSHNNVEVGGVASNIGGWTEVAPHYFGDGWYRTGQYRNGGVAETKADQIFTSFRTTSAAANVPIIIDFCAPHLVAGTDQIVETFGVINNSNVEKDVSGYGNHATIAGTITASPNSPRYKNSYYMQGNSYLVPPAMSFAGMADSYTISYWAKIGDMNGKMAWGFADGNRLNVYPSSWFNWNTGDGADNPFMSNGSNVGFTAYNGGWHHYAITGNGSTATLYIDGVARGTAKTYRSITGTQLIISGWDTSGSYKWSDGNISDYRIYATCLSAEDVAALCNTGASIAKDGTAFSHDFNEFNANKKSSITRNGISTEKLNTKIVPLYDMKIKVLEDHSVWARIHYLDLTYDKTCFTNASEVAKCVDKNNRYSRMGDVEKFKKSPSQSRLPDGYTELEFIRSNGTQYIDTGIAYDSSKSFTLKMLYNFTTTSPENQIMGFTGNQGMGIGTAGKTWWECTSPASVSVATTYWVEWKKSSNSYDRIINGSSNAGSCSFNSYSGNLLLFAAHVSSNESTFTPTYFCHNTLIRADIYVDNKLVRNFVPCMNPSGAIGLYDLVENKFYGNNGTGEFEATPIFTDKYEFMLTYPSLSSTGYNRWMQITSPNATSVAGTYMPISISWPEHSFSLRQHNGSSCMYNCDTGDTWYAPIGQYSLWEGGIPAANGTPQSITELWVRVDDIADANQFKIYNGAIVAADYIEI